MADVTPDVTPAPVPAPAAFDPKIIQEAVRTSIEGFVKEAKEQQATKVAEELEAERLRATGNDPMASMFRPHLEPALKAARDAEARALLAADSAEFYTDPKHSDAAEFRPRIEQVVNEQAKRGNLISRKDAWSYLRGGELYEQLQGRHAESTTAKLKAAQEAATAGPGVTQPKFSKPIEGMSSDELGQALKDVKF